MRLHLILSLNIFLSEIEGRALEKEGSLYIYILLVGVQSNIEGGMQGQASLLLLPGLLLLFLQASLAQSVRIYKLPNP